MDNTSNFSEWPSGDFDEKLITLVGEEIDRGINPAFISQSLASAAVELGVTSGAKSEDVTMVVLSGLIYGLKAGYHELDMEEASVEQSSSTTSDEFAEASKEELVEVKFLGEGSDRTIH